MCIFGGPSYFADKINTGATHALQSVVKISKKIKIFVQKFVRLKTCEQQFTT